MHGSKLPLILWFWAAYLVSSHSNGLSALQLKSQLWTLLAEEGAVDTPHSS
jgi:hypothetical protein